MSNLRKIKFNGSRTFGVLKKRMGVKRFMKFILTIVSVFMISCSTVLANYSTYALEELGIEVTIPSNYMVVTEDTPDNDLVFSELGTTKPAVMSIFESNGMCLSAFSQTYNEEMNITVLHSSLSSLNYLSDAEIEGIVSMTKEGITNRGDSLLKYEIYQNSENKFIKTYFTNKNENSICLQYYTIHNYKAISFNMISYEDIISSRQEEVLKAIVDGTKYNELSVLDSDKYLDSFEYLDDETGVTFKIPDNWKEEEVKGDTTDVQFFSTIEEGCNITYGSMDFYEEMSDYKSLGQVERSRSDINNSAFTMVDISIMFDVDIERISKVKYNDVEYFKIEEIYTFDSYREEVSIPICLLCYFDNGWMYSFSFSGRGNHELYSDFESLLESVEYPGVSNGIEDNSYAETNSEYVKASGMAYKSDGEKVGITIGALLFSVIIILGAIVKYCKKDNKK